jgi:thiamine-monophosphate kinase
MHDMKIENIGEFGIIDRIRKRIRTDATVIKGIGDDCAVLDTGAAAYTLMTCDMIVEGVDFKPGERLQRIGRKALAISLSDIAACGGLPRYCLVSLGLPKRFPVAGVDALYRGLTGLAKEYDVNIVGGDISRAPVLTVDLSLFGEVEKKNLVLRSGARERDVIFVTGSFGGSIRGKHLGFTPRLKESRFLVGNFKLNAMIDCSDGLAADLGHILEASNGGCVIFEHLIPQSKASAGIKDALFSGEDFELIFTANETEAKRIMATTEFEFFPIGSVVDRRSALRIIDGNGIPRNLEQKGFHHF